MSRAKTDRKDALLIARYTSMTEPQEWKLPERHVLVIRNLETYIEGLKRRMGILNNQLHAFEASGTLEKKLQEEIKTELSGYGARIAEKEKEIADLIGENYRGLSKNLRSISGIGPRSASLLIILTGGFDMFESYKQLISFFGLAPRIYESGIATKKWRQF